MGESGGGGEGRVGRGERGGGEKEGEVVGGKWARGEAEKGERRCCWWEGVVSVKRLWWGGWRKERESRCRSEARGR